MFAVEYRNLSALKRYGPLPTVKSISVIEHMGYVAIYFLEIVNFLRANGCYISETTELIGLRMAVTHDIPEAGTGDVLSAVKLSAVNKDALRELELSYVMDRFMYVAAEAIQAKSQDPAVLLVKAADWIEGLQYLYSEQRFGNLNVNNLLPGAEERAEYYVMRLRSLNWDRTVNPTLVLNELWKQVSKAASLATPTFIRLPDVP